MLCKIISFPAGILLYQLSKPSICSQLVFTIVSKRSLRGWNVPSSRSVSNLVTKKSNSLISAVCALNLQPSIRRSLLNSSAIFHTVGSKSKLLTNSKSIPASFINGIIVAYHPAHKHTLPSARLSIFLSSSTSHFLLANCPLDRQSKSKSLLSISFLIGLMSVLSVYLCNKRHKECVFSFKANLNSSSKSGSSRDKLYRFSSVIDLRMSSSTLSNLRTLCTFFSTIALRKSSSTVINLKRLCKFSSRIALRKSSLPSAILKILCKFFSITALRSSSLSVNLKTLDRSLSL